MKIFRIVVGILAILPIALIIYITLVDPITDDPNSLRELVYTVFGIPILILNLWAWIYPEIIEFYFLGKKS